MNKNKSLTDLTGKELFLKNVFVTWGVHIFVVLAGFIVPRQIDRSLGAVQLGIWDLGWASVQYMSLTSIGIGSAVNRFISLYNASGDSRSVIKVTTAAFVWQVFVALVVLVVSVLLSISLPLWAEIENIQDLHSAQIVLFLLGLSFSIKMLVDHTNGVLTGHHLWWMNNGLIAFQDFFIALLLVAVLLLGGQLVEMATAVVCVSILMAVIRLRLIKKHCSNAKIDLSKWEFDSSKMLLSFGIKNLLSRAPQILIFQTAAMLLIAFVNPAALALFNRALALVRQIEIVVIKTVRMFVPMVSSLIGMERKEEAKELLLRTSHLSMSLTIIGSVILVMFGDLLLQVWMGDDYGNRSLMVILSLAAIIPVGTTGTLSVMVGFNSHGKMVIYTLVFTIVFMLIGSMVVNYLGWDVLNVAILCALSWTFGRFLTMPYFLKKYFKISYFNYLKQILALPLLYNALFIAFFYLARESYESGETLKIFIYIFLAFTTTSLIYWKYVLTQGNKEVITRKVFNRKKSNNKD